MSKKDMFAGLPPMPEYVEPPSRETMKLAKESMAESALEAAISEGRIVPDDDPEIRKQQAERELFDYLNRKAAAARNVKELADNDGKPLLRQADIVPPISPSAESSAAQAPRAPDAALLADTETLLNALIAECHFLMREVAFRTMCDSKDPVDRLRFLDVTMGMIRAGATVGDSVARLRHGETRQIRQSFVHEQISGSPGRGDRAQR